MSDVMDLVSLMFVLLAAAVPFIIVLVIATAPFALGGYVVYKLLNRKE